MEHGHTRSFVLSKSCVASKIIWPTKSQILSPPQRKSLWTFALDDTFFPDKINFCFWEAGGVPTTFNCLNPGKGLTVTARARLFLVPSVLLLGCPPLGSQFKTGLPGLPFLGRPRIPVFVTLSLRGFQTPVPQPLSYIFHDLQTLPSLQLPVCSPTQPRFIILNITLSNSTISLLSPTPILSFFQDGFLSFGIFHRP